MRLFVTFVSQKKAPQLFGEKCFEICHVQIDLIETCYQPCAAAKLVDWNNLMWEANLGFEYTLVSRYSILSADRYSDEKWIESQSVELPLNSDTALRSRWSPWTKL